MKNITIFEDSHVNNLYPFTMNHSSFEIRCGALTNLERIKKIFNQTYSINIHIRKDLCKVIKQKFPEYNLVSEIIPSGFYLNGSVIFDKELINMIKELELLYTSNGTLVGMYLKKDKKISEITKSIMQNNSKHRNQDIKKINYLWDAINLSTNLIQYDFDNYFYVKSEPLHKGVSTIGPGSIYIAKNVTIDQNVVLDTREGPIIINEGVHIMSGTIIEGSNFIGKNCIIYPNSIIRPGNSFGPVCRLGGEIIHSIFHGYSNKSHQGFIGHSFIGSWVNLGANTNSSNLKNNYNDIKIQFNEQKIINSQQQFLGVLIGDYTRIAIGTNFNTGTFIGIGANIFNHLFEDKNIQPFSWGKDKVVFDDFIRTIQKMKKRRNCKFLKTEIDYLKLLYNLLN